MPRRGKKSTKRGSKKSRASAERRSGRKKSTHSGRKRTAKESQATERKKTSDVVEDLSADYCQCHSQPTSAPRTGDNLMVDKMQEARRQSYIDGVLDAVSGTLNEALPKAIADLMSTYLIPNSASDEELRQVESGQTEMKEKLLRCIQKDLMQRSDDYYTMALKIRSEKDEWKEAVEYMCEEWCIPVPEEKEPGVYRLACVYRFTTFPFELFRTVVCELPPSKVVELLIQDQSFLVSVAWESKGETVDLRKIALLKQLVGDSKQWLRVLLSRWERRYMPMLMNVLAMDLKHMERVVSAFLPDDSFRHNAHFWLEQLYGEFFDGNGELHTVKSMIESSECGGLSWEQLKAIVCPGVYEALRDQCAIEWDNECSACGHGHSDSCH